MRAGGFGFSLAFVAGALLSWTGVAAAQTCRIDQVTVTTAGDSRDPSLSGDGSALAFKSSSDLVGSNADGNEEIFIYEFSSATLEQVTTSLGGGSNTEPSLNSDGSRAVFNSNRNLVPPNNIDGNRELFQSLPMGETHFSKGRLALERFIDRHRPLIERVLQV